MGAGQARKITLANWPTVRPQNGPESGSFRKKSCRLVADNWDDMLTTAGLSTTGPPFLKKKI